MLEGKGSSKESMKCKPFACIEVLVSWPALENGRMGLFPTLQSFQKKRKKKSLQFVVTRSSDQVHTSPSRLGRNSLHGPQTCWCAGLPPPDLDGLEWPWTNHRAMAAIRETASLKDSKLLGHHRNMFVEWHCYQGAWWQSRKNMGLELKILAPPFQPCHLAQVILSV